MIQNTKIDQDPLISNSEDLIFQDTILPSVSRSFALTIPQLPQKLRTPVANAYLLCRIADTIEDTTLLSADEKDIFHENFIGVVKGIFDPLEFSQNLAKKLSTYSNQDELLLIKNTDKVIRITHGFNDNQRLALEKCITIMNQGMKEFEGEKDHIGLKDIQEMNRYCYYVAGVVGEMLTDLFCDYSEKTAANNYELKFLAVSFGQGLQMTNILKDIWDDKDRNTCWLPIEVFNRYGFDLQNLFEKEGSDKGFEKALDHLIAVTQDHLHDALNYTLLTPPEEVGIRRFCLWAIGMAMLTIRKINKNKKFTNGRQVTISRTSVKATILMSNIFTKNNTALRWMFKALSIGIPNITNIK